MTSKKKNSVSKIMRVALYIRVSTEEQALHGDSLAAQKEALVEYAENKGYKIAGIYEDEGFSARKPVLKRKVMRKLLADSEADMFDMIIFTKIDRWFRSVGEYHKVQTILEKNNVNWKTILEDYDTATADGRLKINIMLSVAENEADRTSERIKFVLNSKIKRHEPVTGAQPWGYKIAVKDSKKIIVKDETVEPLVNEMFEYMLIHLSGHQTAVYMNEKYNMDFSGTTWLRRLKSLAYTGLQEYESNGELVYENDYRPAYITIEQHEKIKLALDTNNTKKTKHNRVYLFTGLIPCPICGRKLTSKLKVPSGRSKQYYQQYRCHWSASKACSYNHAISEMRIERYLLDNIKNELENYEKKVKAAESKKVKVDVKHDVRKYEERLKRLNRMFLLGNIDEDEYTKTTKELNTKILKINTETNEEEKVADIKSIKKQLEGNFEGLYNMMTKIEKKAFWKAIIKEIKVDGLYPTGIIFL